MKHVLFLAALLSLSFGANAASVSYTFTGTIDSITDNNGFLNGEVEFSDTFTGHFTYFTGISESSSTVSDPNIALYSTVTVFHVNINGYIIDGVSTSSPGKLQIWNDNVSGSNIVDTISISSALDFSPPTIDMGNGKIIASAKINLFDFTHIALNSISIPTVINLDDFGSQSFSSLQMNSDTGEVFHLGGSITSLTAVPVPAAVWLFGSGLIGMVGIARRRKT